MKPLPPANPADPQFQAGVLFAIAFLQERAALALADEPTNKGPVLCLTNAAEELERAGKRTTRHGVARPAAPPPPAPAGDLFAESRS